MSDGFLDEAPVWTDITTFDGKPWRGIVDIVTAGWPCQPFSTMGRRKGEDDPRHLWPHVARITRECRPLVLFGENVANHVKIGFDQVRRELREMGYGCEAGVFSAAEVGPPHGRNRLFVMAYDQSEHASHRELESLWGKSAGGRDRWVDGPESTGMESPSELPYPPAQSALKDWRRIFADHPSLKPAFLDVDDELASGLAEPDVAARQNQIRALGNGVVPLSAAFAFCVLLGRAVGVESGVKGLRPDGVHEV